MPFSQLGLTPSLCTPLARKGYSQPTPVQIAAIPIVLEGADLLARAETGTGKTAAFALPMIDRLVVRTTRARTRRPSGLVLVPTRELALQVHRALSDYGSAVRLSVTAIFGGVPMGPQVKALARGTDIVVATPGRLIDHLERRTIDLSAIEILTLDEADRMLDMGFQPALRRVMPALPKTRQTLMFSATLSSDVVRLAADFTRDPRRVDVSNEHVVAPTVTHRLHPVAAERKRDLMVHVLAESPGQALVFCRTKHGSNRLGHHLEAAGLNVAVIHGNKAQGARNRSLADFKSGRVTVLVATDIAARGLDIAQLPLVVNFDLPLVAEDYVHRVGRTGRAGLVGHAVSLVAEAEWPLVREIEKLLRTRLEQVPVAGFDVPSAPQQPAGRSLHGRPADNHDRHARPASARPHRRWPNKPARPQSPRGNRMSYR